MEDILKSLREEGYKPETVEDSGRFEPITGKYICRIDKAGRITGQSEKTGNEYDFRVINLQVAEIIDGDKATNRFLKMTYSTDAKGMKRLLNDLFTAGIEVTAQSDAELDAFLETLVDKTMNIRPWVWTPSEDRDGNPIPEEARKAYQQLRVIKEFKQSNKSASKSENVPF
jgi:hypothetical protein